jgi:predicted flap endonuclease-1-like 5' DNA nuclease
MQYLTATYWMWFIVALFAGGVVGYWVPWRRAPKASIGPLLGWGAAAFMAGLVVAVFHWLPGRAGLYLETLLLLSFWYAIGGLLAAGLRAVISRTEPAGAAPVGSARPEGSTLAARAKAVVKSAQDEAASAKEAEDAQSAAAAKAAEEARGAAAKAAEDARVAVEAKAAEVMSAAAAAKAAKDERLAAEAKAVEEARLATAAAKAAEVARMAAEAKAAEEARLAAAAKAAQDGRMATEAKAAEEARLAAATKAVEDARMATEAKAAEDARLAAAAKDARIATEAKAAEAARLKAVAKAAEDARIAAEAKAAEDAGATATAKAAEEDHVAAPSARADEGTLHPGSKPAGIAVPAASEADDLKLIKGIGPKNEKACHALGIYQFRQIADWTLDEAIWVGHHMAFPGRIEREHWIAQARLLASGGDTEHSIAVKSGSLVVDDEADEPLDPAAAEILGKSLPEQAAVVDGEGKHPGRRPYGLASARGQADNLKKIRGIGPQNEGRLHKLGIWHFSQIAAWSDENVKWVGSYLAFSGRIHREKWVAQARELAAGKDT